MLRGRSLGLGYVVTAFLLVGIAPAAEAACGGVKHVRPSRHPTPGRAPLAIGDSVMLGALPEVARAGFEVDTRGCRQIGEGLRVLRARRHARRLPRLVVLALGTNLPNIRLGHIRSAMRILGPRRVHGLLTPRKSGGGGGADARTIRAARRRFGRRVLVLDWVAYSAGRGGWFAGDGIHLGAGGAAGLGRLLSRRLRSVYPLVARFEATGKRGA